MVTRRVVLLCGPPGSGKTTAAHASGLEVYDRDDPRWRNDEAQFRKAIARLATNPDARAVVIRSGATQSARLKAAEAIDATHVYMLAAPVDELARRVAKRGRADARNGLASIQRWIDRHDLAGVAMFPGWDNTTEPTRRTRYDEATWVW